MNDFTYRLNEEPDKQRLNCTAKKKKFNYQQWIARFILIFIVVYATWYTTLHTYYTTYDGYVHVDENKVRAPHDIFLDSIYVHVGDRVMPGDTLYSYHSISHLLERFNPNREPAILSSNREMQIKQQAALREILVLRVQINELRKQIKEENRNISLGLSSNSHRLDLERTLSETEAKMRARQGEYAMYRRMIGDMPTDMMESVEGRSDMAMIFDDVNSPMTHAGIAYNICSDSSIVTDVKAPNRTVLFQKEDILTTQHLNLEANNLSVIAYVPVDMMHRITLNSKATVIVNSDFEYTATVTALGLRTDEIPENLRSYFAKKCVALIARLSIDPGQHIPFWCLAAGLPVDVRLNSMDTWGVELSEKNYLWYETGKGVSDGFPEELIKEEDKEKGFSIKDFIYQLSTIN